VLRYGEHEVRFPTQKGKVYTFDSTLKRLGKEIAGVSETNK
jgi:hypothetical protein